METTTIRQKLHQFIDMAEDKKINAIYTLIESEIEGVDDNLTYSDEFVAELDKRWKNYLTGEKGYTQEEVNTHTKELLKRLRTKSNV